MLNTGTFKYMCVNTELLLESCWLWHSVAVVVWMQAEGNGTYTDVTCIILLNDFSHAWGQKHVAWCLFQYFFFVTYYFSYMLEMLWKYRLDNNLVYTRALAWCSGECPALVCHNVTNMISLKLVSSVMRCTSRASLLFLL